MSDKRTRSALKKALEGTRPDASRFELRASAMMVRAREQRAAAANSGVLIAVEPLARRLIPALGAAAALLVLGAGVSWWQRASAPGEAGQVTVTSALLAGYEVDAERDPLTAAVMGDAS